MESAHLLSSNSQTSFSMNRNEISRCEYLYDDEKQPTKSWKGWQSYALLVSFLINMCLAIFILWQAQYCHCQSCLTEGDDEYFHETEFARLRRNVPLQWQKNIATTQEEWNDLWNSSPLYPGIISLPDDYARSKGLPRGQRFPWDANRGIYVINGYHNLHCVMNIKAALEEYHEERPQTIQWPHIQHCLLVLRSEILCNADDTPRYTGFQRSGSSGVGQFRLCRDWNQLEQWAVSPEQESCWRNAPGQLGDSPSATRMEIVDRYRFCSDESPYKNMSETAWTDPADWEGIDDEEVIVYVPEDRR